MYHAAVVAERGELPWLCVFGIPSIKDCIRRPILTCPSPAAVTRRSPEGSTWQVYTSKSLFSPEHVSVACILPQGTCRHVLTRVA